MASELDNKLDFAILLAPANHIPDVGRTRGYRYVPDCEEWYADIDDHFDASNPPKNVALQIQHGGMVLSHLLPV